MESEKNFLPRPEKPEVLYHASRSGNVEQFEPRDEKKRDETEQAQIFATPSKAMATVFLVDTDDSWTHSGAMDSVPYIVISDRQRFEALDTGSYLYSLPSDSFESDPEKGLRELEYTSIENVEPVGSEYIPSALNAMLENGVRVYFVDSEVWHSIETSHDGGEEIILGLEPFSK